MRRSYDLRAGDAVIVPAGTIISGTNAGKGEVALVIVRAYIGKSGPPFVHGRPHRRKEEPQ